MNKNSIKPNDELNGSILDWKTISDNILYRKNKNKKLVVLFFYDSFLLPLLDLYLDMFNEVYMIKDTYNKKYIDIISPDYTFEFRVERFLN